jgi:predicted anti-sigma-YlaC factor YlaD
MNNNSCDVVRDLLPLYHDGVCNASSVRFVEEHLAECEQCREMLEKIKNNAVDNYLVKVRDDVVRHHTQAVRRKFHIVGISLAAVAAVPVVVSLIVNLAVGRALDWFFIVLTSLMVFASLTVVPLVSEKNRGMRTLGSFAVSLTLLLLTCAIYTGGDWFFMAIIPVLFGLSVLFAPFIISQLPLKGFAAKHKGLLAMCVNTVLLFAVIIISGLYAGHSIGSIYWQSALLSTLSGILLPWGIFVTIRYLKANGLIKAGLSVVFGTLYFSVINNIIELIISGTFRFSLRNANLLTWNTDALINANISLIIILTGLIVGGTLLAFGFKRHFRP